VPKGSAPEFHGHIRLKGLPGGRRPQATLKRLGLVRKDAQDYYLSVDERAPNRARGLLKLQSDGLDERQLEEACLLVSECVTNVVLHSGLSQRDTLALTIGVDHSRLRVEVADNGTGYDKHPVATHKQDGAGYGLQLVEAFANRFEIQNSNGFKIWFELDHPHYLSFDLKDTGLEQAAGDGPCLS
jgi:anti-sigma regulatory factor (Ser/Thr protein kinase)